MPVKNKSKLFIGLGIGLLVILVIIGVMSFMSDNPFGNDSYGYPKSETKAYLDECVSGAQGRGPDDYIKNYCDCTLNYLEKNFTYSQFSEMSNANFDTMKNAPKGLKDAMSACTK